MRSVHRSGRLAMLLAAAVLGLCSSLLVACGDRSRLIPAQAAAELDDDLQKASDAVQAEECQQAKSYVRDAISGANDLDESVDPRLRRNLDEGLAHVSDRISAECGKTETTATTTTPTETTTTPPRTETEPPTPQPTTTTPPPTPTIPQPGPGPGNGGTPPGGGRGNDGSGGGNSGGGGGDSASGNGTGGSVPGVNQ